MSLKPTQVRYWQDRFYKGAIDPAFETIKEVLRYVHEEAVVLDFGAGAGEVNGYGLKGRCKELIGVDYDPRVVENPLLDRGIQLIDDNLPLSDHSVDIIFSIYVFEHIQNPEKVAKELNRVLKPGGRIIGLTPNKWHYVSLMASMTPLAFHKWFNRSRGFSGDDTFPTCYRLNTPSDFQKYFPGFQWEIESFETQPNYLKFNTAFFLAGVAYERLVNRFEGLSGLRVNMIFNGLKPS